MALEMMDHLFRTYGAIAEIDLKEESVNMIGAYNPSEPLYQLIGYLEKGKEFSRPRG